MKARDRLAAELKARIGEVSPREALALQARGATLVDVREADEIAQGTAPGALRLGRGYLELRIEEAVPDPERTLVVLCGNGARSLFAAEDLARLGYRSVYSLAGGFTRWKNEGLPVEVPFALDRSARERYSRHLLMPEVGEAGQAKLMQSIKDRPVAKMMLEALATGRFAGGRRLLDWSSGNAGISYAMLGSVLGVPVTVVVPGNASTERLDRLAAHGAQLVITNPLEGYDFALREAQRIAAEQPDRYWHCDQYANPDNWRAHLEGTARRVRCQQGHSPAYTRSTAHRFCDGRRVEFVDGAHRQMHQARA